MKKYNTRVAYRNSYNVRTENEFTFKAENKTGVESQARNRFERFIEIVWIKEISIV